MEKEWFFVGFPEYIADPGTDKIWAIFDTLKAVNDAIREVNDLRATKHYPPIIGCLIDVEAAMKTSWRDSLGLRELSRQPAGSIRLRFWTMSDVLWDPGG